MLALYALSSLRSSKCFSEFTCLCTGRYYLVDAGYSIRGGYLPPYLNRGHHLEDLKGKCALGPFLSILVIKCPTKMVMC
jgi:hypothetical protein